MKIVVTGGAGFIGSNFIRYMLVRYPKYQLINLDTLTYAGNPANLADFEEHENYTFIRSDITDTLAVDEVLSGDIDVVVNFAAESHVDRSILEPGLFLRTNVLGTHALLEAARKYNVRKFVQVSTDEVYGTLPQTGKFKEDSHLSPNSPYSSSKASADLVVRAYHETYGLPVNITRCSNNYGPYQFPEKFIPLMILRAIGDKNLPVYGDGLNVRDWLHVEDHCAAIDLILHKGRDGEVYNIGGNNEYTNIEVVKRILNYLGKSEDLIRLVKDRLGHDRRYAIDATKLRTELGWEPKYNFDLGLMQTITWYLSHKEWWEHFQSGDFRPLLL